MIRRLLLLLRDMRNTPLSTVEARRKLLEESDDRMESRRGADTLARPAREIRDAIRG